MKFIIMVLILASCTRTNPCRELYEEAYRLDAKARHEINSGDRDALESFDQYLIKINEALKCSGEALKQ